MFAVSLLENVNRPQIIYFLTMLQTGPRLPKVFSYNRSPLDLNLSFKEELLVVYGHEE